MPDVDKKTLKENTLLFLKSQQLGAISTVTKDFLPEVAIVFYIIDDNWDIYILTHNDSRKFQNISENPHVAFAVGYSLTPRTVQIEGYAEIIDGTAPGFELILNQFDTLNRLTLNPLFAAYKDHYAVIKLKINWLRVLEFDQMTNNEKYTVLFPSE